MAQQEVLLTDLLDFVRKQNYETGIQYPVDVVHLTDPHDFYVRLCVYNDYLAMLIRRGRRIRANEIPGKEYIYKSRILKGEFARGQINARNSLDLTYTMFALDYGFEETKISFQNIFLPIENTGVPPLATHCMLADVCIPKDQFSRDIINAMQHYLDKQQTNILVRQSLPGNQNKLAVNLIVNNGPIDMATLLNKLREEENMSFEELTKATKENLDYIASINFAVLPAKSVSQEETASSTEGSCSYVQLGAMASSSGLAGPSHGKSKSTSMGTTFEDYVFSSDDDD